MEGRVLSWAPNSRFRPSNNVQKHCKDNFLKGATLGFFCGIIAILAHAVSANSFIIIRIAEPFWLLAGLILLIPKLTDAGEATAPGAVQALDKPLPA